MKKEYERPYIQNTAIDDVILSSIFGDDNVGSNPWVSYEGGQNND